MDFPLVVEAHPQAVYYLRTQGLLLLGFVLFVASLVAIILLIKKGPIRFQDKVWLGLDAIAVIACAWAAISAFRVERPTIVLDGSTLQVGDVKVPIDASTEISYRGEEELVVPPTNLSGYFSMPGDGGKLPMFWGGPELWVRTGSAEVSFKPVLYGPAAFFDRNANQPATELIQRLVASGTSGNARSWLAGIYRPVAGPPEESNSFRTFLIFYLVIMVPLMIFFGRLIVLGIKTKFG